MAESRRRDALALLRNGQVDGADFYCGDEELGHIHLNGEVHLATSPAITRALIAAGAADRFPWAGAGEWITYRIGSDAGVRHAERLFRLGYDYLGGTPESALIEAASAMAASWAGCSPANKMVGFLVVAIGRPEPGRLGREKPSRKPVRECRVASVLPCG